MDGSLVIMEHSVLSIILLLQWMVALSLCKVVCCRDFCYSNGWQPSHYGSYFCCREFCYSNGWQPSHYGRQSVVEIFFISFDGSLDIMEGSLLSRFLIFHWMVALSLRKVVCCRDFCFSNAWQPCHYGRQYVVEIFVTPIDGILVIMEHGLLSRFLLLNGWYPYHYGRQSVVEIFVTQCMVALSLWKVVCCRDFCYSNGLQP